MAERSSSTVPIIVAVIGVMGTIAAAVIANWDKISGNKAAIEAPAAQAAEHNAAAPEASAGVRPAEGPVANAAVVNVAGTWSDADGHTYVFQQDGSHYSFKQFKQGAEIGSGEGSLDGHRFSHNFTSIYGDGKCDGEVSQDGALSEGICSIGDKSFEMKTFRSAGAKS